MIISLDASTTCIGYSVWEKDKLITYGKLKPDKKCDGWRERLLDLIPQVHGLIARYFPTKVYCEDVPLSSNGGIKTGVILGAVQGALIGACGAYKTEMEFVSVATWRKDIGLFDGTKEGKKRDNLKEHSVNKANEMFNLDLQYISPSSSKNDDDISDSILLYASTRDKYKVKKLGRKPKLS